MSALFPFLVALTVQIHHRQVPVVPDKDGGRSWPRQLLSDEGTGRKT